LKFNLFLWTLLEHKKMGRQWSGLNLLIENNHIC
jgi:hypothetical protein